MRTAVNPKERRGMEMIKKCLLGVMRLLPLRKAFVLESHPDFSDNTYALYEELLRRGYQIVLDEDISGKAGLESAGRSFLF